MIGYAAGVDMMYERVELGRVAHESIEHKGRFARCGDDHIGLERPVAPREKGVNLQPRVRFVLSDS